MRRNSYVKGSRHYELINHTSTLLSSGLGNVLAVVSDRKIEVDERYAFSVGGGYKYENGAYHLDASGSFAQLSAADGIISSYAAEVISATDYYAFGAPMPSRSWQGGEYRYGFGGHEKDDEIKGSGNHLSFGDYGYDPRTGKRWNVDPKFNEIAGISPYAYALDNPIVYIDKDGELPILPLLLKAGSAGAADMLTQAAVAYFFDPKVETAGQAFEKVNWVQVARSSAEGLIPWRTPGGKIGKAAATAVGDVLVNAVSEGSDYTGEQALQDFAVGFIGDLGGGEIGDFVSKYGAEGVAKGLSKMGFDDKKIEEILTGAGTTWKGPVDYSDIADPKDVGVGKPFKNTKHRNAIFDKNKSANNGNLRDDSDGTFLNKGKKGGSDPKQAEIDHKRAKSRGGDNSSKNAQVLSKQNNRKKGTN
ncbi:MAG: hypothetical protein Q8R57_11835 [Bacteroidota bacterium]|nr:hypothetical protein [Bacteroidota bacterium]